MTSLLPNSARHLSLSNVVFITYALFMAGFYFVPNAVDLYKFYIAAVFLPGLLLMRDSWRTTCNSPIFRALTLYLLYLLLSSLWSQKVDMGLFWRDARYTAYIIGFVLLGAYFTRSSGRLPQHLIEMVSVIAGLSALTAIVFLQPFTQLPPLPQERMIGYGITGNPNPSAFIYGLAGLVALHGTLTRWGSALGFALGISTMALWIFVILTQSNTGMLALLCSSATLFLGGRSKAITMIVGAMLLVAATAFLAWSLGFLGSAVDPGFNERLPIWQHCIELWRQTPVFGQGLQKVFLIEPDGSQSLVNYAHSLFLATLRDGGLVGIALLFLLLGLAFRAGIKQTLSGGNTLYLAMLCFGLIVMVADVDQAITRPRELWIILWLPLLYLVACELQLKTKAQSNAT